MGTRSFEGQRSLPLEGEFIDGAVCFDENGASTQRLRVGEDGFFYNEREDAFEWNGERHGYMLLEKAAPEETELKAIMERLRNDPQNRFIRDNDNAIRAKAELVLSASKHPTKLSPHENPLYR